MSKLRAKIMTSLVAITGIVDIGCCVQVAALPISDGVFATVDVIIKHSLLLKVLTIINSCRFWS